MSESSANYTHHLVTLLPLQKVDTFVQGITLALACLRLDLSLVLVYNRSPTGGDPCVRHFLDYMFCSALVV